MSIRKRSCQQAMGVKKPVTSFTGFRFHLETLGASTLDLKWKKPGMELPKRAMNVLLKKISGYDHH
jgi:hypothetical protein